MYTRETLGEFSLRRLQLGVGGSKGHTAKGDCRRSRLVQGTQEHGPLVMMVNHIVRELVPEWFTWTTIQVSCNETTAPHQHRFDSTPWSAVFSTGQHVVVRFGWKREASAVGHVADQGEGSARMALAVQATGTVSIGNL